MDLTVSVVAKKRRLAFRLFLLTSLLSVVVLLASIVFLDNKIINTFLAAIVLISGSFVALSKQHSTEGSITLNEDGFTIINAELQKHTFELKAINEIELCYQEFEGEGYNSLRAIGYKKGLNNYLTICQNNCSNTFEILLRKTDLPKINRLVGTWKKKGVQVRLTDKMGKTIEAINY